MKYSTAPSLDHHPLLERVFNSFYDRVFGRYGFFVIDFTGWKDLGGRKVLFFKGVIFLV